MQRTPSYMLLQKRGLLECSEMKLFRSAALRVDLSACLPSNYRTKAVVNIVENVLELLWRNLFLIMLKTSLDTICLIFCH